MKYIDADKLKTNIKNRYDNMLNRAKLDSDNANYWNGKADAYRAAYDIIDSLQKEQTELTQVPRIEQETQKKGWMDYGLLISEIGLHRSNAIDRIKETKERAAEIKRNIAPHDLAILCKYLESVGAEIVLCCLQRYCMDFMFTQDEVEEILRQEQPEVDLDKEIDKEWKKCNPIDEGMGVESAYVHIETFDIIARHFYELGLNARKVTNITLANSNESEIETEAEIAFNDIWTDVETNLESVQKLSPEDRKKLRSAAHDWFVSGTIWQAQRK